MPAHIKDPNGVYLHCGGTIRPLPVSPDLEAFRRVADLCRAQICGTLMLPRQMGKTLLMERVAKAIEEARDA